MKEEGVLLSTTVWPTKLRAVTHLDVGDDDIDAAIDAIPRALGSPCPRLRDSPPSCARSSRRAQSEQRAPSVAGAVVRGGEVVWADAVGLADAEQGEAATPDHQYRIGSITKTFTAVGVMQLRDAGQARRSRTGSTRTSTCRARRPDAAPDALARLRAAARDPGDVWETLEFPKSTDELLATMDEAERCSRPGSAGTTPTSRSSCWRSRRAAERHAVRGLRRAADPAAARADAHELRSRAADDSPTRSTRTATSFAASRCSSSGRRVAAAGSSGRPSAISAGWAAFLADPIRVLRPNRSTLMTVGADDGWIRTAGRCLGVGLALRGRRIYCGHDGGMPGYLANVLVDRGTGSARPCSSTARTSIRRAVARARRQDAAASCRARAVASGRAARGARDRARPLVVRGHGVRLPVASTGGWRRVGRSAPDWQPLDTIRAVSTATASGRRSGRERGELLRLVRDADGSVTRMYWATYPLSRESEVTGTAP